MKRSPNIRSFGVAWRGLRSRRDAIARPSRLSPGYLARCILLLAICLALAPAGRAFAGNTTITFENIPPITIPPVSLSPGTALTSQYHNRGVDFPPSPRVVLVQTAYASSGTQVADIGGRCYVEICDESGIRASFTSCHMQVQLHVGSLAPQQETTFKADTVVLVAYDKDGNVVGQASGNTTPHFGTVLSVTSPAANIYAFSIAPKNHSTVANTDLGIDDLSFDNQSAACTPYYTLSRTAHPTTVTIGGTQPVAVLRGGSATIPFFIHASANWAGTIALAASAVPVGVSPSFSTQSVSGPGDTLATLTLTAAADAPLGPTQMTVSASSATPNAEAEAEAASLTIPVLVQGLADARVTGIEITQGIQSPTLDTPSQGSSSATYHGVRLVEDGVTVVRVFVDSRDLGPNGTISPPPALLLSARDDKGNLLSGSPRGPQFTPVALPLGEATSVPLTQRLDPGGAYVFDMPASWTVNGLSLTAQLDAKPGSASGSAVQCSDDPQCASNNSFTLSGITFVPAQGDLTIEPVELRVNNTPLADPNGIFGPALNLLPAAQGRAGVGHYYGTVDITDIASSPTTYADDGARAWDALVQFMDNAAPTGVFVAGTSNYAQYGPLGQVVIGVYPQRFDVPNGIGGMTKGYTDSPVAVVSGCDSAITGCTPSRPLSSDAHELGHALGRLHASGCNGGGSNGQRAESWPPDEQGNIHGVGLDRRPGSGGASGPYAIIAPTAFDFMSYCAQRGGGDTNDWISVPGWNEEIDSQGWPPAWSADKKTTFSAPAGRVAQMRVTGADPQLLVRGFLDHAGKVVVTEVEPLLPGIAVPLPAAQAPILSTAGYRIVTRDAHGARLTDVPVDATRSHVDGNGRGIAGSNTTFLYAVVPASGAASLSIVQHGTTLFQRVAPPHIPSVAIVAPATGATVGRATTFTLSVGTAPSTVRVAWQTADPDSVPRIAMVDYSADGGTTWRPVYLGPDKGSVDLSSTYFAGSRTARVRVRVNDGFHEGLAVSGLFAALGAPPTVRIDSPVAGAHGTIFGGFSLRGTAFDDANRPLRGRSLAWSVDGRQVGSGGQVMVSDLDYGTHQVSLQATDGGGRTGSAVVSVTVCCNLTLTLAR